MSLLIALVVGSTVVALALVLYAAYREMAEDLPCKRSRRVPHTASQPTALVEKVVDRALS